MTDTFFNDISSYQTPVTDAYTFNWLSFRGSVGYTQTDSHLAVNLAWAKAHTGPGKQMTGYTYYHVYYPGNADQQIAWIKSRIGTPDQFITFMMDIESWSGQISGNHSAEINYIFAAIVAWLGGDWRRVWCYGNGGDLASICPQVDGRVSIVIAGYSSKEPARAHLIWQYAGGGNNSAPAGYPLTDMWGKIDFNVAHMSPQSLAVACGIPILTEDQPMIAITMRSSGGGYLLSEGWTSKFGMDSYAEWQQLLAAGAVVFKLTDAEIDAIPDVGAPNGSVMFYLQTMHNDLVALGGMLTDLTAAVKTIEPGGNVNMPAPVVNVSLAPTVTAGA